MCLSAIVVCVVLFEGNICNLVVSFLAIAVSGCLFIFSGTDLIHHRFDHCCLLRLPTTKLTSTLFMVSVGCDSDNPLSIDCSPIRRFCVFVPLHRFNCDHRTPLHRFTAPPLLDCLRALLQELAILPMGLTKVGEVVGLNEQIWPNRSFLESMNVFLNQDYWEMPYSGPGSEPKRLATTLHTENEESCTTYNMLKVPRNLFRWTKEMAYADYYERALTNGVLSIQRGKEPGIMIYMLPLGTGVSKATGYHKWGSKLNDFWCCYGTGIESFSKLERIEREMRLIAEAAETAHEKNQKYKEGKSVLERCKLRGPDGSSYWVNHEVQAHFGGSDQEDV
ncbi:hypothetical protein L1887_36135 [Cichorium endivia]|nr:hypothetical protein L1887_36135 [Cichorium endivia]